MSVYKVKATGRWAAQVFIPGEGKRHLGTKATKKEAQALVKAFGSRRPSSRMTVAEWRDIWLANPDWRESTRMHNAERTSAFAAEYGDMRLASVDRTLARTWLATHDSQHGALSALFGAAMYEDNEFGEPLVAANPFSKLVKRKQARRDLESGWLTPADIAGLEGHSREVAPGPMGEVFAAMIRVAAETGIRPGELFVLRDEDVMGDRLRVARSASSKTRTITLPKNGREREVALSAAAAAAIGGMPRLHDELLFATPLGRQFWGSTLVYYWHPVRAAAGRPTMDFYELRHYCATRLLEVGVSDADVAVQLGHTDGGELVRRVYGHPSQRRALDRVRDVLDRGAA